LPPRFESEKLGFVKARFSATSIRRFPPYFLALSWALVCAAPGFCAPSPDLDQQARAMKAELSEKVLPYWYDTAQDKDHGGYLLADAREGLQKAEEKQLVTQSRMIWGFAHAHRHGFSSGQRDYLAAATQGYRFLREHFFDPEHGGYFWKTDLAGHPVNRRKIVYGQSFVIYALVEYSRAAGNKAALQEALDLYHALQKHAHDAKHGGWIEHFEPDWTPILSPVSGAEVEVPGLKSANTHLHLMEALTELYEATKDEEVRASLEEALRINMKYFYPPEPGQSCFHRHPDWSRVTDPKSAGLSYGHNVEFAWLMIRAEKGLGLPLSWDHFQAHLDHALKYGYDREHGGLYNRGADNKPATQTDKVWWIQAEMLAALTEALQHKANPACRTALESLIHFIWTYQVDPKDGIWMDTVTAQGRPKSTGKAHNWKANYHDVRAMMKFIAAFGGNMKPAP
jgi:cellobiose epimerase